MLYRSYPRNELQDEQRKEIDEAWNLFDMNQDGKIDFFYKTRGEARVLARILEQMDHDGFDGYLPVQIAHCDNAAAAGMLEHGIHAKWPQARVLIHPCGGLCSFYAQDQGIILTY